MDALQDEISSEGNILTLRIVSGCGRRRIQEVRDRRTEFFSGVEYGVNDEDRDSVSEGFALSDERYGISPSIRWALLNRVPPDPGRIDLGWSVADSGEFRRAQCQK